MNLNLNRNRNRIQIEIEQNLNSESYFEIFSQKIELFICNYLKILELFGTGLIFKLI